MRELLLICIALGVGFGLGVFWRSRFQLTRFRPTADREARRKMWEQIYR